jgi:hypothetical protein
MGYGVVGAMAAVTGSAFGSDDASAGKTHKKRARMKKRPARARHLGDACRTSSDCASGEDLHCENVGEPAALPCECDTGFVACGGVCIPL